MDDFEWTIEEQPSLEWEIIEAVIKPEQTKNVTPTYEEQSVTPDEGFTLGRVNVGAIPPVVLQNKQVTPTKQTQNVTADDGYSGLESVEVEPIPDEYIIPAGKKQINITQNGTTLHDVTEYADAEITVNTDPIKGVVYGNYDSDGFPNSARFVGEWKSIPSYYFWNFARKDGTSSSYGKKITTFAIPETVETVGASAFINNTSIVNFGTLEHISEIGNSAFNYCTNFGPSLRLKDNVILGNGSNLGGCFKECFALKSVTFLGNVIAIPSLCFDYCRYIELYDFSHCTAIPNLFNTGALFHKSGCVIRIPAALSDTTLGVGNGWESATNWSALTNIVWEVV